eukprot:SAG11_NODE_5052_length_1678_cov_1.309056_1_plen_115_part_00
MGILSDATPLLSAVAALAALLAKTPAPQHVAAGTAASKLDVGKLVDLSQLYASGNLTEDEFVAAKSSVFNAEPAEAMATHTWKDVEAHNTEQDCWVVIVDKVGINFTIIARPRN